MERNSSPQIAKNLLVTPTFADWTESSQLIWRLHKNRKNISDDATKLQNDALICHSAFRQYLENPLEPCVVVTDNLRDFELLAGEINKRYQSDIQQNGLSKLIIKSGADYFN